LTNRIPALRGEAFAHVTGRSRVGTGAGVIEVDRSRALIEIEGRSEVSQC
jgi:hypothetical protein